jgi:hypothetical protein
MMGRRKKYRLVDLVVDGSPLVMSDGRLSVYWNDAGRCTWSVTATVEGTHQIGAEGPKSMTFVAERDRRLTGYGVIVSTNIETGRTGVRTRLRISGNDTLEGLGT